MTRQQKIAIMKKRRKQRRLITAVFTVLAVISVTLLISSFINRDNSAEETTDYIEYTVKSGDTLWDIAQLHSGNNVDVRTVIYDIEETNQIKSAMIYCGDILLIPTKYCGD